MKTLSNIILINAQNYSTFENVEIGGKARNLINLQHLGFNVPKWIVLDNDTLQQVDDNQWLDEIQKTIIDQFPNTEYWAVRSSANIEDSQDHSFAGQFTSKLFITKEQLPEAIKEVCASVKNDNVTAYCQRNNLNVDAIKMAVIVQEMIDADVSGVGFGVHPVSHDPSIKVLNACYGLGEGLVSGLLNADLYTLNDNIEKEIASKTQKMKYRNGALKLIPVEKDLQDQSALTDEHIIKIKEHLAKLEEKLKHPQDIEFALKNGEIFLLQTRPVTTVNAKSSDHKIVWDNSNIVESYPGQTLPLTYSFIKRVYERAYIIMSQVLGISNKNISRNKKVYMNMLGLINGRVYYNLYSWYRILAMLPGYSINAGFMETMMGVKESFQLSPDELPKGKNYLGVIKSLFSIFKNLFTLNSQRDQFLNNLESTIHELNEQDYAQYSTHQLINQYNYIESRLLENWKAPLINDLFAMIFYGTLEKLTKKWLPDVEGNFHNELLAGSSDIISVEPIKYLKNIQDAFNNQPHSKTILEKYSASESWKAFQQKDHHEVNQEIQKYLTKFGDRTAGELKLETITYTQDPVSFIQFIKDLFANGTEIKVSNNQEKIRKDAEDVLSKNLNFFRRWIYKGVLKKARTTISNRENMRFERTRAFSQVRRVYSAVGNNWAKENVIKDPRDVFYLSLDEINDFANGTSVNGNLKSAIEQRKIEYKSWEDETPSDRIETFGTVYSNNDFFVDKSVGEEDEYTLTGIGCCAGKIKAEVSLIMDPKEVASLNGNILVTSCTDPSWVTLFPSASGIIVERGSMLSHSAIVAREMGIPCIVAVSNVIKKLKTGDLIEMDGRTGKINILSK